MKLRQIAKSDNQELARIIRQVLTEFKANLPGTVYYDVSTDALFELFQIHKAVYFVVEEEGKILGGGGIYPTSNLPEDTCELVKMYLLPEARGKGYAKELILKSISQAKDFGFKKIYLESMPELKNALLVYEKFGFRYLDKPLGNSGHFGCKLWMVKNLES